MSKNGVFRKNLLWLAPIALILLGVLFVVASLQERERLKLRIAPLRLEETAQKYAPTWANRQAAAVGNTTTNIKLKIVSNAPNGTDAYNMRGLVTQLVSPTPSSSATTSSTNTVITCVEWQVDVITGAVRELHAVVMRLDFGSPSTEQATLEQKCLQVSFS